MTFDREKFVKVCGLLGSDMDGQVLAAVHQANKMLRAAGLVWSEALGQPNGNSVNDSVLRGENQRLRLEVARLRAALEAAEDEFDEVGAVKECLRHLDHVNDWEQNFLQYIGSALTRWGRLTDKQRETLDRVITRLKARGVWEGGGT